MANLISKTHRYAYIRYAADAVVFAHLVHQFGGNDNLALREIRRRFDAALAGLVSDVTRNAEQGLQRIP